MLNSVKNFAITFCISLIIFGLIAFIVVELFLSSPNPSESNKPSDAPSSSVTDSASDGAQQ